MTGLEPATSGVTGRRSNQLSYIPIYPNHTWAPPKRLFPCGVALKYDASDGKSSALEILFVKTSQPFCRTGLFLRFPLLET